MTLTTSTGALTGTLASLAKDASVTINLIAQVASTATGTGRILLR